jgi:phosphoheptose isomerase
MLDEISSYLDQISALVLRIPSRNIEKLAMIILDAYERGNRIFIFGNGGGSATSEPLRL